ncbi:MAG: HlyD family efflux transporter periplasmic adaptor subunit [Candidatus Kapabacteria bacterium]|nr:HlyD family efflux transporter periplasmic adaptor subunit [Candidatus Kapabacteria bacterium]MCS7169036.1 HlyD family efflux transporter periplasmic adaptor subunit [Candidatus Kapabacteria bacterium]MDW7997032.1 HlyD family efflux transporter periplasmic adaptor subunit [Bacteroidota bacterium]MDW8224416.1 HlyD family efflux transporter periplasmic adaptor subunit [Bacteroidota bacterium]
MNQRHGPRWEELEHQLLPAEELPESLETQLVRPSARGLWLFWGLTVAVVVAAVWAALTELDIVVRSRGYTRSLVPPQVLRSPLDGLVEDVPIRLHQRVQRGDTLMRLRDSELRVRLHAVQEELRHEEQLFWELSTLARMLPSSGTPSQMLLQLPSHTRWETPLARTLTELIRKELQLFARHHESLVKRWERTASLHKEQFASTEEYEAALTEVRLQELRALQYVQSHRQELAQRLEAIEHRLQELRQQSKLLQERLSKTVITANSDGQVTHLAIQQSGVYVAAGQELLTISPDARLEVELLVWPQDIALVRPGQRVRYLVSGFPLGQWEPVWGQVESVAEDISVETNTLAYRVRASLDSPVIRARQPFALPYSVQLRKGLPVEATIFVGRKPIIAWLYDRSRHFLQRVSP